MLRDLAARRVVVAGTDADLAAVLRRLLRRERLDVEVAYLPRGRSAAARVWGLPPGPSAAARAWELPRGPSEVARAWGLPRRPSAAARVWGLPRGPSAAARAWELPRDAVALALEGAASPVPLIRDDAGGVLVGGAEVRRLRGEVYCDETLVLRGAGHVVVTPGPDGVAVRASRTGSPPDGRTRAVSPRAPVGRGSAVGRAVQLGGEAFTPALDGVPHTRAVTRWAWYRHTADWLLVRPSL